MPASIVFKPTYAVGETSTAVPTVIIDDYILSDIWCIRIEDSVGMIPSKATLVYRPVDASFAPSDETGPVTLEGFDWYYVQHGARVIVLLDGSLIFAGSIHTREDQGGPDTVIFTAYDDRMLFEQIPIRGAVTRDPVEAQAKLITRFLPRTNPGGDWNCTGNDVFGNGVIYPVFTDTAKLGSVYESPEAIYKSG
ncbi:unnamed protein product, partial [marine sediment metagenome]